MVSSAPSSSSAPSLPLVVRFSPGSLPFAALSVVRLLALEDTCDFQSLPTATKGSPAPPQLLDTHTGVVLCRGAAAVAVRLAKGSALGDVDPGKLVEWVEFTASLDGDNVLLMEKLFRLNHALTFRTFVLGVRQSVVDLLLWQALKNCSSFIGILRRLGDRLVNLSRWFSSLESIPEIGDSSKMLLKAARGEGIVLKQVEDTSKTARSKTVKDEAGDVNLPDAKMGQVVTRFPPEPSGYLHIGHAKAALINDYFAKKYRGKMLLRFDDTNPSKEKMEFQESIVEDLKSMGIEHSSISHSSDHFDMLLNLCTRMIEEGKFYADCTPEAQMKEERFHGTESKYRYLPVEESLAAWEKMQAGTEEGLTYCIRARIDMKSANKVMCDPVMYRCNLTPHPRTGSKYNVYPVYDFCCPIVDSVEGVTHTLRTNEYADRDALYHWVLEAVNLRKPIIWEFSRLNFVRTVMSKRKLQWFVDTGRVEDWTDPRFPTIRGLLRRGLKMQALRDFVLVAQGTSRNTNLMSWEKLWTFNKKYMDPIVPRHTAVDSTKKVVLALTNGPEGVVWKDILRHKKNPSLGTKRTAYSSSIYLDLEDAKCISKGEEFTLMDWGNCILDDILTDGDGNITELLGHLHLEGDFKTTKLKLTWLSKLDELCPAIVRHYDYLITADSIPMDGKFEDYLNPVSMSESEVLCDVNVVDLKLGDALQLERRGYFNVDRPWSPDAPMILVAIPDGRAEPKAAASGSGAVEKKKGPSRRDQKRAAFQARQQAAEKQEEAGKK